MFKKKKIINKKKSNKVINLFGLIVIFLVFITWIFAISYAKQIDFFGDIQIIENNKKTNIVNKKELDTNKKEEKQVLIDNNKINLLLIGRWWKMNDAPNLTDSIIIVSINKKLKTISMFSIPRDLYVKYENWKYWKINKAYAVARAKTWSNEAWIDALKYNIELLTWEKIDYYINIDFNGFINFIDSIWWVKIIVPKTLVDNKFPDHNWGYRTFIVKKWTWIFDWETALNYARSRHSTSDFDRSIRQQQIIQSIRKKITEGWFFSKINKAKIFYDVLGKYVFTDIWLTDAISIFNEVKDNSYKIILSNLNDSCFDWDPLCKKWWFLYTPERNLYWGASVLLINGSGMWKMNNYKKVKKYMDLVFNNSDIFKENINISIYNSTKTPLLAWNTAFELRRYWFNIPNWDNTIGTIKWKILKKSLINYRKEIKNTKTIKYLKNIFKDIDFVEVEELEYTSNDKSEIEIIISNDYLKIFKNLKNNL